MPLEDAKSLMAHLKHIATHPGHDSETRSVDGDPGTFLVRHDNWLVMYEVEETRSALYVEIISSRLSENISECITNKASE